MFRAVALSGTRVTFGLVCAGCVLFCTGCGGTPPRIALPGLDPVAAGQKALALFDANKDGAIAGDELNKCPGVKAALKFVDKNSDGRVTAEEITARLKHYEEHKVGIFSAQCKVVRGTAPQKGLTVQYVPEPFLTPALSTASGETNDNGIATLTAPGLVRAGVPPGFYRVEINRAGNPLPAQFNTQTVLGRELALDSEAETRGLAEFDITPR